MTEAVERGARLAEGFWSDLLHPRAPAGSAAGGQFTAGGGGGGGGAKGGAKGGKGKGKKGAKTSHHRAAKAQHGSVGLYAGYGQKNGSPQVRRIQTALNRMGFKGANGRALKLDGKLGPQTTAAIKAAQRKLGVPVTGRVTPAFLRRLNAGAKPHTVKAKVSAMKKTPAVKAPAAKAPRAPARGVTKVSIHEASINGTPSFSDVRDAVDDAVRDRVRAANGGSLFTPGGQYVMCAVLDLTATDAVYQAGDEDDIYQCSYTLGDDGEVTLGDPALVVRTYAPAPPAMAGEEAAETPEEEAAEEGGEGEGGMAEARDRIEGRVIEAAGTGDDGGRIFRVRIIKPGDSKNGRRYPAAMLREAAPLYEGSRAYDHHRTESELRSSTIAGLVGSYRNVTAEADGLYGDLHLLPSASHAAEALDATLAAQEAGRPPLIGVSHDVMATYRPVVEGGKRLQEATAIVKVNSADLVADPAAGGKATRMVAGGVTTGTAPENQEDDVSKESVLAALAEATDDELAGVGLARVTEAEEEDGFEKSSVLGRVLIREAVKAAELPERLVDSLTKQLPDRITEADVTERIASLKDMYADLERGSLAPSAGRVQVTQEALEKKIVALDKFFQGDIREGYTSFRTAWADFTGYQPRTWDADVAKQCLRESLGVYDSGDRFGYEGGALRLRESLTAGSWTHALGDSITRQMVAEYSVPDLQVWRQIVSKISSVPDFRTQRRFRTGGYGTLPTVAERDPYQPLTSPTDEEATYSPSTYGGTEDITRRMILADDVNAIAAIPRKLGRAAAQTLYRAIFDIFVNNAAVTYDSTALFHTNHSNTGSSALSSTALSTARIAMQKQAAYGNAKEVLDLSPQTLIVPPELYELAWQLATSAVALPSGAPVGAATNIPNINAQMKMPIRVPYYTDTNDWYAVADPGNVPTIEVGFIGGRQDPELFTQSDPTVGAMFDRDVLTYKVRHEWGWAVLDHRGFYRNTL